MKKHLGAFLLIFLTFPFFGSSDEITELKALVQSLQSRIEVLEKGTTTAVAFSVFRNFDYVNGNEVTGNLVFDHQELNVGQAFDLTSGLFQAPIDGSYFFFLSAASQGCFLHVVKNDIEYFSIATRTDQDIPENLGYSWGMELKAGDTIQLRIFVGHLMVYYDPKVGYFPINFSGFLIK